MPLLAILDENAHGALDDSLKTLYVQNSENRQFYLDIPPDEAGKLAFNLQGKVTKLEDNNKKLMTEKANALERLKPFESLGKSPEEITATLASNQPENVTKLVTDYETKLSSLKASYEEPLTKAKERAESLQRQMVEHLQRSTIQKLRNEFDLNETAEYVLRDFIRVVPVAEGSDEFTVKVYENGQPALKAGEEMKPDQLINGFREAKKFAAMFNAGDGGGTGASNRQTGANGASRYDGLSPTETLKQARRDGVQT